MNFQQTISHTIDYDSLPQYVAVGDFNKDNHLDLAVANSGAGNIGILLGYGNGTFASQITYPTGLDSNPYSVAVGDFNNDTLLDIAVANYGTNNIGILLGYGNGSFASQIIFPMGSSRPLSLAVGDFDNDLQLDIAVANAGTLDITLLLGFGNGSFRIEKIYKMDFDSIPYSIAIADFNNDNQLDIAIANDGTNNVVILLANENKTFISYTYSTGNGSHPCSLAIGDLNSDNRLDIAVANSGTNNIYVFFGYDNGAFTNITISPTGSDSAPQFIVIADFNMDTKQDMIVANSGTDNVVLFLGYGNGTFTIGRTHSTGFNSDPYSIAVGDFDNDNRPDIAITNNGINNILVLTSYTIYLNTIQMTYSTGIDSQPNSIAIGDFNNDNHSDIVVANNNSSNIGIFLGLGDGIFESLKTYFTGKSSQPNSVAIGDFNNDHNLDIAVGMAITSGFVIYLGNGDGTFEYSNIYQIGGFYPVSIAVGDFNNDNNLDIVTAIYGTKYAGVFHGYGDGTFTLVTTYSTESNYFSIFVAVGDFNNDHLLDFAVANYKSATISIHLGYGNESFRIPIVISTTNAYPSCLAIGDLNNDRKLDIVFTDPFSSNVDVILGYGNGSFGNIITYSTGSGSYPWSVALGHINNDTSFDIAVADQWSFNIGIFLGYGNGTFGTQRTFSTEFYSLPSSIGMGDFNNDNQPDIVVSNSGTNDINVFLLRNDADFANENIFLTGSSPHPYSVAVGDFNNDSQLDIAVANSGTDNVQILLDYNKGNFMNTTIYSTGSGSHPQYVTVADINKDRQLDIVVVNSWHNDINVFFGLGNGTFDEPTVHLTGSESFPHSIVLGDFNKDDYMDAAIANTGTNNIGIFLGFDYPTFTSYYIPLSTRISIPFYVIVADFNNDYRWDIAVANSNIGTVSVFLGYGNGTFTEPMSYLTGSSPISLAVGDFNNDNQLDIAVANAASFNISILLGYGNGTFAEQISYSTDSSSPVSIAVGDFNNDTRLDIVVANKDGDNVGVFLGYDNGTFEEQVSYWMPNGSSPVWIAVGDINNDNILDIAVANVNKDEIGILLGYGNGTFGNVSLYSTGDNSGPCSIAIGDLNKDSFMDIVVANQKSTNVGIFFGCDNDTFSLQTIFPFGSESFLTTIAIGDLNNDSALDIVVSDWDDGNGNISVLYGYGNGKFATLKTYSTGFNSYPLSIAICDFNNDSRADLATVNSNTADIVIMLRYKSTPFSIQTIFPTGNNSFPVSVAVGDLNNDNQLDIVVANIGTNNVGILLGYGDGIFGQQKIYSTGYNSLPCSVALGDFNNDGQLDIAVANIGTTYMGILFGYGNGTFSVIKIYSTRIGSSPSSITVADLNKDDQLDIVVTNIGINNVMLFLGTGNGTFLEPKSYTLGYNARPLSAAIGDFNNDSLLDIAVANYGTNYVQILLQTC